MELGGYSGIRKGRPLISPTRTAISENQGALEFESQHIIQNWDGKALEAQLRDLERRVLLMSDSNSCFKAVNLTDLDIQRCGPCWRKVRMPETSTTQQQPPTESSSTSSSSS